MKTMDLCGWRFFIADSINFKKEKVGKWMYFFRGEDGRNFTEAKCREAVETGIVQEAKCTNSMVEGVSCFYLNSDDTDGHKRVIKYLLDNRMIQKTKTGRYYNISFKLDEQTRAGEYGDAYKSDIKLANFIDLNTGEWII